ncbi:amine-terminal region of a tm vesicle-mediated sorter, partial [Cystoisospora suis]
MSLRVSPSMPPSCCESRPLTAGRLGRGDSGADSPGSLCFSDGGSPNSVFSGSRSDVVRQRWRFAVKAVIWLRALRAVGSSLASLFSPVVITILRHHKAYVDLRCRHRCEAAKARAARANSSMFLGRFRSSTGTGVPSEKDLLKDLRRMEEEELLYLPTELLVLWYRQAVLDPGLPAYDLFLLHRHAPLGAEPAGMPGEVPTARDLEPYGGALVRPAGVEKSGSRGLSLRSVMLSVPDADSAWWPSLVEPSLPPLSLPPFTLTASLLPRRVYNMVRNLFPGTSGAPRDASPLSIGRRMRQHFSLGRFRQGAGRAHLSWQYGRRGFAGPWSSQHQSAEDEWTESVPGYLASAFPQQTEILEQADYHLSRGQDSGFSGSGYGGNSSVSLLTGGEADHSYLGKPYQWSSQPENSAPPWGPVSRAGPPVTRGMQASPSWSPENRGGDTGSASGVGGDEREFSAGQFGMQRNVCTEHTSGNLFLVHGAEVRDTDHHPWEDGQQPWQKQQAGLRPAAAFYRVGQEQTGSVALSRSRAERGGAWGDNGARSAGMPELLGDPAVHPNAQASLRPPISRQQGLATVPEVRGREHLGPSESERSVRPRGNMEGGSHALSATSAAARSNAGVSVTLTVSALGLRLHHLEEQDLARRFQWRLIEDSFDDPRLLPPGGVSVARSEVPTGQLKTHSAVLRGGCCLSRKWTHMPPEVQASVDSAGVGAVLVSMPGKRRERRAVKTGFRPHPVSAWRVENGVELPESALVSAGQRGRGVDAHRTITRGQMRQKRTRGLRGAMETRLVDEGEWNQAQHFLPGLRIPRWGDAVDIMLYDVGFQWQLISARHSGQGDISCRAERSSNEVLESRSFSTRGLVDPASAWKSPGLPGQTQPEAGMVAGLSVAEDKGKSLRTWILPGERCVFWWFSVTNGYAGPAEPSWKHGCPVDAAFYGLLPPPSSIERLHQTLSERLRLTAQNDASSWCCLRESSEDGQQRWCGGSDEDIQGGVQSPQRTRESPSADVNPTGLAGSSRAPLSGRGVCNELTGPARNLATRGYQTKVLLETESPVSMPAAPPQRRLPTHSRPRDVGDGSRPVSNQPPHTAESLAVTSVQSPLKQRSTFAAQLKTRLFSGLRRSEKPDFPSRLMPARPGTLRFRKSTTTRPQLSRVGTRLARGPVGISRRRSGNSDWGSSVGSQSSREVCSSTGSSVSHQEVPSTVGKGTAAAASRHGHSSTSSSLSRSLSPGGEDGSDGGWGAAHRKRFEREVHPDVGGSGTMLLRCSCSPTTLSCDISMPFFLLSPALLRFLTSVSKLLESPASASARLRFYEEGAEGGGDSSQAIISRRNGLLARCNARRVGGHRVDFSAKPTVDSELALPLYIPLAIPSLPPPSSSACLTACLVAADEAADMACREATATASTTAPPVAYLKVERTKDTENNGVTTRSCSTGNQGASAFSFIVTPTSSPSSSFSAAYRAVLDDVLDHSGQCHSDSSGHSECGENAEETFPPQSASGTKGGVSRLRHGSDCDPRTTEAAKAVPSQPLLRRGRGRFSIDYLRSLAAAAATTAFATVSEATSRAGAAILRAEAAVRAKQAQLRNSRHGSQWHDFLALEHLCLQHQHWVADHSLAEQRTLQVEISHLLVLLPTAAAGMPKALRRARYRWGAGLELTGTDSSASPRQQSFVSHARSIPIGQTTDLFCEEQPESACSREGIFSWPLARKVAASPFFQIMQETPSRAPCGIVSCRTITAAMTPSSSASPQICAAAVEGLQIGVSPQLRYLMHVLEAQVAVDGFPGANAEASGLLSKLPREKASREGGGAAEAGRTAQITSGENAAMDFPLGRRDPREAAEERSVGDDATGRRTPLLSEGLDNVGDPESLSKKADGSGSCYLLLSCPGIAAEFLQRPPNTALARADGISKEVTVRVGVEAETVGAIQRQRQLIRPETRGSDGSRTGVFIVWRRVYENYSCRRSSAHLRATLISIPPTPKHDPVVPGAAGPTVSTHRSADLYWCFHAGASPAAVLLHSKNFLTTVTSPSFFLLPLAPVPLARIEAHSLHFLLRVVTTWDAAMRACALASSLVFVPFYVGGLSSYVADQGTTLSCKAVATAAAAQVPGFHSPRDQSAQASRLSTSLVSHSPAGQAEQPIPDRGCFAVAAGAHDGERQQPVAACAIGGGFSALSSSLPSAQLAGKFFGPGEADARGHAARAILYAPKACFLSAASWTTLWASGWYVFLGCRPGVIGCGSCASSGHAHHIAKGDENAFSDFTGAAPFRVSPQGGEFTDVGGLSQNTVARLLKSRERSAIDGLLGAGCGPERSRNVRGLSNSRPVFWCEWRRQPASSRAEAEESVRLFRAAAGQPCCNFRPVICPLTLWIYRHPTDSVPVAVCHALALSAEMRCPCYPPSGVCGDTGTSDTIPAAYCSRSTVSLLSVVVTAPAPAFFSRLARPAPVARERRLTARVNSRRQRGYRNPLPLSQAGPESVRGVAYSNDQSLSAHMAFSALSAATTMVGDTEFARRSSSCEQGLDGTLEANASRARPESRLHTRGTLPAAREHGGQERSKSNNGYQARQGCCADRSTSLWTWVFQVRANREWQLVTTRCCARRCRGFSIASSTCTGCCARSRAPSSPSRIPSGLSDSSAISSLSSFGPKQAGVTFQEQRHLSLCSCNPHGESPKNRLSITQDSVVAPECVRSFPPTVRRTPVRHAGREAMQDAPSDVRAYWKCRSCLRRPGSGALLQRRNTGLSGIEAREDVAYVPGEPNLLRSLTPRLSQCSTPAQGRSGASLSSVSIPTGADLQQTGRAPAAVPPDGSAPPKARLSGVQAHLCGVSIKLLVDRLAVQLLPPSSPLSAVVNLYSRDDMVPRVSHHYSKCVTPLGQMVHGRDLDRAEAARQLYVGQLYGKLQKQQEKWRQQQLQRGALVLTLVGVAGSVVISPLLDPVSCVDFVLKNAILENSHVIPQSRRRVMLQGSLRTPRGNASSGSLGSRQQANSREGGGAVSGPYQKSYDVWSGEVAVIRGSMSSTLRESVGDSGVIEQLRKRRMESYLMWASLQGNHLRVALSKFDAFLAPQTIQEVCTAVAPLVSTVAAASAFGRTVSKALTVTLDGSVASSSFRAGKVGERTVAVPTPVGSVETQRSPASYDGEAADSNWTVHLTSKGVVVSFLQCYTNSCLSVLDLGDCSYIKTRSHRFHLSSFNVASGGLGLPIFLAGEQPKNSAAAELFTATQWSFTRTRSRKAKRQEASDPPDAEAPPHRRTEDNLADVGGGGLKQGRRRHLSYRRGETKSNLSCLDPVNQHVLGVGSACPSTSGLCPRSPPEARAGSSANRPAPWLEVAYSPLAHRTAVVQERLSQHGYLASSCSSMSLCIRDSCCLVRIPEFLLLFQFLGDCRTACQEVLDRLRRLSRHQHAQLQQLQQERLQKLRQIKHFEQQQRRAWAQREVVRQQTVARSAHGVERTGLPAAEGKLTGDPCSGVVSGKQGLTGSAGGRSAQHQRQFSTSHGWTRNAGSEDTSRTGLTLLPPFLLLRVRVSFPTFLLAGETMEEPPSVVVSCGLLQVSTQLHAQATLPPAPFDLRPVVADVSGKVLKSNAAKSMQSSTALAEVPSPKRVGILASHGKSSALVNCKEEPTSGKAVPSGTGGSEQSAVPAGNAVPASVTVRGADASQRRCSTEVQQQDISAPAFEEWNLPVSSSFSVPACEFRVSYEKAQIFLYGHQTLDNAVTTAGQSFSGLLWENDCLEKVSISDCFTLNASVWKTLLPSQSAPVIAPAAKSSRTRPGQSIAVAAPTRETGLFEDRINQVSNRDGGGVRSLVVSNGSEYAGTKSGRCPASVNTTDNVKRSELIFRSQKCDSCICVECSYIHLRVAPQLVAAFHANAQMNVGCTPQLPLLQAVVTGDDSEPEGAGVEGDAFAGLGGSRFMSSRRGSWSSHFFFGGNSDAKAISHGDSGRAGVLPGGSEITAENSILIGGLPGSVGGLTFDDGLSSGLGRKVEGGTGAAKSSEGESFEQLRSVWSSADGASSQASDDDGESDMDSTHERQTSERGKEDDEVEGASEGGESVGMQAGDLYPDGRSEEGPDISAEERLLAILNEASRRRRQEKCIENNQENQLRKNTRVLTVESVSITESISSSDRTPSYVLSFSNEPSAYRGALTSAGPNPDLDGQTQSHGSLTRPKETQLVLAEESSALWEPLKSRSPRSSEICLCRFPVVLVPSLALPIVNKCHRMRLESTARSNLVEHSVLETKSCFAKTHVSNGNEQECARTPATGELRHVEFTGWYTPDESQEDLPTTVASLLPTAAYVLVGNPSIVVAPMLLSALHFCLTFPVHAVTTARLHGRKPGSPTYSLPVTPSLFPSADVSSSPKRLRREGAGPRGLPRASFLRASRLGPRHAEGTLEVASPVDHLARQRTCSGESIMLTLERNRLSTVGSLPMTSSLGASTTRRGERTFSESETLGNSGTAVTQSVIRDSDVKAPEADSSHEYGRRGSTASYRHPGGVAGPALGNGSWPSVTTTDQGSAELEAISGLPADLERSRLPGVRFRHSFLKSAGGSSGRTSAYRRPSQGIAPGLPVLQQPADPFHSFLVPTSFNASTPPRRRSSPQAPTFSGVSPKVKSPPWNRGDDQGHWSRQPVAGFQEGEDNLFFGGAAQRGSGVSLSPVWYRDGRASASSTPTSTRRQAVPDPVLPMRPSGLASPQHFSGTTNVRHGSPLTEIRTPINGAAAAPRGVGVSNNLRGNLISGHEDNGDFPLSPHLNRREQLLSRRPVASAVHRLPTEKSCAGGGEEGRTIGRARSSSSTSYDAALFLHPCLAAVQQLNILASWMAGEFRRQQLQELESAATRAARAARVKRKHRGSKGRGGDKKSERPRGAPPTYGFEDGARRQFSVTERLLKAESSHERRGEGGPARVIGDASPGVAEPGVTEVTERETRQASARVGDSALVTQDGVDDLCFLGQSGNTPQVNATRWLTAQEQHPAETRRSVSSAQLRQHAYLLQLFQLLRIAFPKGGTASADGAGSVNQCVKVTASAEYVHFSVDELRLELAATPASFVLLTSIGATRTSQVLHFSLSVGDRHQALRQTRRLTHSVADVNESIISRELGERLGAQVEKGLNGPRTAASEATGGSSSSVLQPQVRSDFAKARTDSSTSRASAGCHTKKKTSGSRSVPSRLPERLRSRRASRGSLRPLDPLYPGATPRDRGEDYLGSDAEPAATKHELSEELVRSIHESGADAGLSQTDKGRSRVLSGYDFSSGLVDKRQLENCLGGREPVEADHSGTNGLGDHGRPRAFWDPFQIRGSAAMEGETDTSGRRRRSHDAEEASATDDENPFDHHKQGQSPTGGVVEMRATVYCADSITCTLNNCTVTVHKDASAFLSRGGACRLAPQRSSVSSSIPTDQDAPTSFRIREEAGRLPGKRTSLPFSHSILPPATASLNYSFSSPPFSFLSNCVRNYRRAVADRTLCGREEPELADRRGGRFAFRYVGKSVYQLKRASAPSECDNPVRPTLGSHFSEQLHTSHSACSSECRPSYVDSSSSFLVLPAELALTPSILSATAAPLFFPEDVGSSSLHHPPKSDGTPSYAGKNRATEGYIPDSEWTFSESVRLSSPLSPPLHTVVISLSPVDLSIRTWDIQHLREAVSLMLTDKKTHRMLVVAAMEQGEQTSQPEELTATTADPSRISRGAASFSIDSSAIGLSHHSQSGTQNRDAVRHPSRMVLSKMPLTLQGTCLNQHPNSVDIPLVDNRFRACDEETEKALTMNIVPPDSGGRGAAGGAPMIGQTWWCIGEDDGCLRWAQQPRDDGIYRDKRSKAVLEGLVSPQGYPNIMAWDGIWTAGIGDRPNDDLISNSAKVPLWNVHHSVELALLLRGNAMSDGAVATTFREKPAEADPGPTPTSMLESFLLDFLDLSVAPSQLLLSLPRFSCVFLNDVFEEEVPSAFMTDSAVTRNLPLRSRHHPALAEEGASDPVTPEASRMPPSLCGYRGSRSREVSEPPGKISGCNAGSARWPSSFAPGNNIDRGGGTRPLLRVTIKGIRAAGTNAAIVSSRDRGILLSLGENSPPGTDLAVEPSRRDSYSTQEAKKAISRVDPSKDVEHHNAQPLMVALQRRLAQKQLDSAGKEATANTAQTSVFSEELLVHGEATIKVEAYVMADRISARARRRQTRSDGTPRDAPSFSSYRGGAPERRTAGTGASDPGRLGYKSSSASNVDALTSGKSSAGKNSATFSSEKHISLPIKSDGAKISGRHGESSESRDAGRLQHTGANRRSCADNEFSRETDTSSTATLAKVEGQAARNCIALSLNSAAELHERSTVVRAASAEKTALPRMCRRSDSSAQIFSAEDSPQQSDALRFSGCGSRTDKREGRAQVNGRVSNEQNEVEVWEPLIDTVNASVHASLSDSCANVVFNLRSEKEHGSSVGFRTGSTARQTASSRNATSSPSRRGVLARRTQHVRRGHTAEKTSGSSYTNEVSCSRITERSARLVSEPKNGAVRLSLASWHVSAFMELLSHLRVEWAKAAERSSLENTAFWAYAAAEWLLPPRRSLGPRRYAGENRPRTYGRPSQHFESDDVSSGSASFDAHPKEAFGLPLSSQGRRRSWDGTSQRALTGSRGAAAETRVSFPQAPAQQHSKECNGTVVNAPSRYSIDPDVASLTSSPDGLLRERSTHGRLREVAGAKGPSASNGVSWDPVQQPSRFPLLSGSRVRDTAVVPVFVTDASVITPKREELAEAAIAKP